MTKAAKITPGMQHAMDKLPQSGRKCPNCGLEIPTYKGRYPARCPECGTELSFGEEFSKAVNALYVLDRLVEKKQKTTFGVEPKGLKRRYYKDLADIAKDFTEEELRGASVFVVYGAVVVGYLETDSLLRELF